MDIDICLNIAIITRVSKNNLCTVFTIKRLRQRLAMLPKSGSLTILRHVINVIVKAKNVAAQL